MVTYEIVCGGCGKEMLFEHARPLDDPGTLPAFCSNECSKHTFKAMVKGLIGVTVEVPCGCLCHVFSVDDAMPWLICEAARGNYVEHSHSVFLNGLKMVRQQMGDES